MRVSGRTATGHESGGGPAGDELLKAGMGAERVPDGIRPQLGGCKPRIRGQQPLQNGHGPIGTAGRRVDPCEVRQDEGAGHGVGLEREEFRRALAGPDRLGMAAEMQYASASVASIFASSDTAW